MPKELRACEQVGLSQDRVGTIIRAFYASLFSTFAPQFERLQDPGLRERIRVQIAQSVYEAHLTVSDANDLCSVWLKANREFVVAQIHRFISLESNGYDRSMLAHSVEEVGVLLGYEATATALSALST